MNNTTHNVIFEKDGKSQIFEKWEKIDDSYVVEIDQKQYINLLESARFLKSLSTEEMSRYEPDCGIFKIYDIEGNKMMYFACFDEKKVKIERKEIYPLTGDIIEEAEDMELAELRRRAIEDGIPAEELDDMDW